MSRTQGLQDRGRVKGSPGLWGDAGLTALQQAYKETGPAYMSEGIGENFFRGGN